MKRRDLVTILHAHGCVLVRHGSRHDVFRNTLNGSLAPIPRHREVAETLVRQIFKELGVTP